MAQLPQTQMPDIMGSYARLGDRVSGVFSGVAAALQQYGNWKTEKEMRKQTALELESLGTGVGKAWMDTTSGMPLEDAMQGAANATAYHNKLMEVKAQDPQFVGGSDVKSLMPILAESKAKDMYTIFSDIDKGVATEKERAQKVADAAKVEATQTGQQETLRNLSTGLSAGGFENQQPFTGGNELATGQSGMPDAMRPGVREITKEEYVGRGSAQMPGGRIAGQTTQETAMSALNQVANPKDIEKQNLATFQGQFQSGKDLNAQVAKKEALAISKYRAKNAAEKALSDKSLKEKMLAIVAGKTNLEAQDRRQMIGILEQDARIKAADPMLEPGQKQEWLQKADDYNNVLEYSQQNAEVLQDVTSGMFAAIAKKYPDMNTRRPKVEKKKDTLGLFK